MFDKLSQTLEEHWNPVPSVIAEQFNLYICANNNQTKPNHLRLYHPFIQIKFCKFGPTIQDMLRDLLVVGVADDYICRRLLAQKELNFDQARQIALVIESADKNVHNVAACSNTTTLTQPNINHIDRGNSGQGKSEKQCFRCDGKHSPDYCHFRDATCNFGQKTATFQQPALKGKVLRAPEITKHIRSTEMTMTMTHILLLQETLPQCINSSASPPPKLTL